MSPFLTFFNRLEWRVVAALPPIYMARMLGLFMVLPVISYYASLQPGQSPLLIGLAVGIYGLTQALFQLPFGLLSDYIGRRPVVTFGLLLFASGSLVAALSDSIGWLIVGRGIQGAGAVAGTMMALAADLTRPSRRTAMMALIGAAIGLSFPLALVLGPVLVSALGFHGLFWVSAVLALAALLPLFLLLPRPPKPVRGALSGDWRYVLRHPMLWRFNATVFLLHLFLTALFVVLPRRLLDAGLEVTAHWQFYLPLLAASLLLMLPLLSLARRAPVAVMRLAGIFLLLALALLHSEGISLFFMAFSLALFFGGFNALEALLPTLLSRFFRSHRGAAMGSYSACQFFGAFVGGVLGAVLYGQGGDRLLFLVLLAVCLLWWLSLWFRLDAGQLQSGEQDKQ